MHLCVSDSLGNWNLQQDNNSKHCRKSTAVTEKQKSQHFTTAQPNQTLTLVSKVVDEVYTLNKQSYLTGLQMLRDLLVTQNCVNFCLQSRINLNLCNKISECHATVFEQPIFYFIFYSLYSCLEFVNLYSSICTLFVHTSYSPCLEPAC